MTVCARARSERGQASLEMAGTIVWLVIAGLFAWQLALVGWTAVSATNAARTASRLVSRGIDRTDAEQGGQKSLASAYLGNNGTVTVDPQTDKATVTVPIPIVMPGLTPFKHDLTITMTAEMPYTG
jgi:Flp pilus assembly protein TadG